MPAALLLGSLANSGAEGGKSSGSINGEKKQRYDDAVTKPLPETKKRPIVKFAVKSFNYKIDKV
jgi:hypothetical protein